MVSYFTLPSLFLNTELWPQKCVPIKGDMMDFLPCSESHSSPQTKKKTALILSPLLLPLPFPSPSHLQPSNTLLLYTVWVIYDTLVVQQDLREQTAVSLSFLAAKWPLTKEQLRPSHLLLHERDGAQDRDLIELQQKKKNVRSWELLQKQSTMRLWLRVNGRMQT